MKKRAIVLGSTGSIGRSSLDVLASMPDEWEVVGLSAQSQVDLLVQQADEFRPPAIALGDERFASQLRSSLSHNPRIVTGSNALVQLLESVECDCVICGVVGAIALNATLAALRLGRRVALANKEVLVIAGPLVMATARQHNAEIIPVDSEHSAIFQARMAGRAGEVHKIFLTASGGPFRTLTEGQMETVSLEQALNHPTWDMGPKISIDSATMMNKALEIVEARWLFDVPADRIDVLIHPESVVHSIVEFCDGTMIAQMGTPDMRCPIQYALTYPERRPGKAERLNLIDIQRLNFDPPDETRFPALRLGREVATRGGTCGAVLNAANEMAVERFREGAIRFRDISRITERILRHHDFDPSPDLEKLMRADRWARKEVDKCLIS